MLPNERKYFSRHQLYQYLSDVDDFSNIRKHFKIVKIRQVLIQVVASKVFPRIRQHLGLKKTTSYFFAKCGKLTNTYRILTIQNRDGQINYFDVFKSNQINLSINYIQIKPNQIKSTFNSNQHLKQIIFSIRRSTLAFSNFLIFFQIFGKRLKKMSFWPY